MTEVRFYHLQARPLGQALPDLLGKALSRGQRLVIKTGDAAGLGALSSHLWMCRRDDIFPHGTPDDADMKGMETHQPIWLTAGNENPNGAQTLILVHGAVPEDVSAYQLVCEMLDGNVAEQVDAARGRFKDYKAGGHDVTYWQQTASGWEKKA